VKLICAFFVFKLQITGQLRTMWGQPFVRWGGVALCAVIVLIALPAILRHRIYELFFALHVLGAAVFLAGTFYHGQTYTGWVYFAVGIYTFDRSVRLLRLAYLHILIPVMRGEHPRFVTVEAESVAGGTMMWLHYPTRWEAGCHVYISFFGSHLWWHPLLLSQNHPFSIASTPRASSRSTKDVEKGYSRGSALSSSPRMLLVAKQRKGMTRWLASEIRRQGGHRAILSALVEGPYGPLHGSNAWKGYDKLALFAAGSGITHVFGLMAYVCQLAGNGKAGRLSSVDLVWVIPNLSKGSERRFSESLVAEFALTGMLSWISNDLERLLANAHWHSLDIRVRLFTTRVVGNGLSSGSLASLTESEEQDKLLRDFEHVLQWSQLVVYTGRPDIQAEVSKLTETGSRVQLHGALQG
jgi:hypothetical protein